VSEAAPLTPPTVRAHTREEAVMKHARYIRASGRRLRALTAAAALAAASPAVAGLVDSPVPNL